MRALSRGHTKPANRRRDLMVEKRDRWVESTDPVDAILEGMPDLFLSIWRGKKPTAELFHIGDVTLRQAERIMARKQRVSSAVLIRLLRSDHGLRVLFHLMEGSDPQWWADNKTGQQLASIQRKRRELEQEELAVGLKFGSGR